MNSLPFLIGAQYYRAPTPEPACWETDLRAMKRLGFNCVKYWVQWRWSHRRQDRFVFDDLDRLMDLAHTERLAVHLNVIFDVSPHWLFEKHPDAKQINALGRPIEPRVLAHRQIGGAPGPCYNHPGALAERKKFLAATIAHFRDHPALAMWDVWNEPELSFPVRKPETYQDGSNLVCYCPHCRARFHAWLRGKYASLDRLNDVWGRCYEEWFEVELPTNGDGIVDFVDWREFQQDTLTAEAAWRLELAREAAPAQPAYLHVVPNTMRSFNSLTGPEDLAILRDSCVYASSGSAEPMQLVQSQSAAAGKLMYNVESHINGGMVNMHQRVNRLPELLRDWLPQIGMGFRGFMFWQYRPEVLGREAPAWGVVDLDGSPRPITEAARTFIARMTPFFPELLRCRPSRPAIGIWQSRKNEFFHYSQHVGLEPLRESVEAYVNLLYRASHPVRFVYESMLAQGALDDLKVLILPACYYLTQPELTQLDRWVRAGGIALVEAHLGAYNGSTGRHERLLPGGGLAAAWGIVEELTTSSYHLQTNEHSQCPGAVSDDVKKALAATGTTGGKYFPIVLPDGGVAWGAERFALLEGAHLEPEGTFSGQLCLASKPVGRGHVYYCGANLGEGSTRGAEGLQRLLQRALDRAGHSSPPGLAPVTPGVRVDALSDDSGVRFLVITNLDPAERTVSPPCAGEWIGLFTERRLTSGAGAAASLSVEAGFSDIFVRLV